MTLTRLALVDVDLAIYAWKEKKNKLFVQIAFYKYSISIFKGSFTLTAAVCGLPSQCDQIGRFFALWTTF